MAWIRDRSLGILFLTLFLSSWIGQLFVGWKLYVEEEADHGEAATYGAYAWDFWTRTLENWQSEFLQLGSFVIAAAYFVYKGSAESPDSGERLEAKLDALLEERGIKPGEIERTLPVKFHHDR
ncbi:MAG: hypothetical protein ICV64_04460 [Thermoleophilia bacterium]|nr:hypothetical protein [Thermoleophilia bacterium]